MRKKMSVLATAFMLMLLLVACGCDHTWVEATCMAPKTCSGCGLSEGDVLEHAWSEWAVEGNEQVRVCSECESMESMEIDRAEMAKEMLVGKWVSEYVAGEGFETVYYPYYSLEFREDGTVTLAFEDTFENHWEFVEFHDGKEQNIEANTYVMYLNDYNLNAKGSFWLYESLVEGQENFISMQYSEGLYVFFYKQ